MSCWSSVLSLGMWNKFFEPKDREITDRKAGARRRARAYPTPSSGSGRLGDSGEKWQELGLHGEGARRNAPSGPSDKVGETPVSRMRRERPSGRVPAAPRL